MENVIIESLLNASPARIWKAITDKDEMKNWYFDIPDFSLELHHVFNFYEPGGKNRFHHQCEIVEIIPTKKLKYTWSFPEFSNEKTLVQWEIIPVESGTQIKLTHSSLEKFKDLHEELSFKNFETGWDFLIHESLKPYVEK